MKRLKLLVLMALLVCVMAGVVYHASPLAPVVGGPVEIEALWEIEDTREESEEPLVTALLNHGVPMAYEKNENTFYCSLGLENAEEWPELHLTVQNAPGVTVCFSDDYTYDYCMDAIAEGYSYELMAYNDTHYSYFYIVFTGLPVVSINTDQDITIQEDTAHFSIGTAQEGGLSCESLVRLRGDGSLYETQKLGYRIAFANSRRNAMREVPGMGVQGKINLVSMAFDDTLMHDKLSWDLIAMMTDESAPFSARKTQYVELFVNNEYEGVYLMMEPIDYETEIGKASSGSLLQDALYRTAVVDTVRSNAVIPGHQTWGYELFYSPDAADQFSHLRTYIALRDTEDDAEFARLALEHIDMKSAMGYCAFLQNAGLVDNVQNNMFIWAHTENGKISYRFMPWDMDRAWGMNAGGDYQHWSVFPVADRLLNLNIGDARQVLNSVWNEMKARGFTYETIEALVRGYENELHASGAAIRNAYRWETNIADGTELLAFSQARMALFEKTLDDMLQNDGPIAFLSEEPYAHWQIYVDMPLE